MHTLLTLILAVMLLTATPVAAAVSTLPVDGKQWHTQYDPLFRKWSKRWFGPAMEWRWFKAQAIAESALDEKAVSWVGAKGLMQLMPATFAEIQGKNPEFTDVHDPRWNIAAGIFYDAEQYRRWEGLLFPERLKFTFASYNAGAGNVLNARREAKRQGLVGDTWRDLVTVAPRVTRWRSSETIGYVRRIFRLMGQQEQ